MATDNFPNTAWPTDIDTLQDRTNNIDVVEADDFDFQATQAQALQQYGDIRVADYTELRALDPPVISYNVHVMGRTSVGDGGEGIFIWESTSTASDNDGTIIAPGVGGTGRWLRVHDGVMNVLWFGATGDGTTDDRDSINTAITAASGGRLVFPPGTYRVASTLNFPSSVTAKLFSGSSLKPDDGVTITVVDIDAGDYQIFDESLCITGGVTVTGQTNMNWFGGSTLGFIAGPGVVDDSQTVSSASNLLAVDCSLGWNVLHTLTENTTIQEPTNPLGGQCLTLTLKQVAGNSYLVSFASTIDNTETFVMPEAGAVDVYVVLTLLYHDADSKWVLVSSSTTVAGTKFITATYDFAVHGGLVGDVILGHIPDNSYIVWGEYDVTTALTSAGAAQVAFGIDSDDPSGLRVATDYDHADFGVGQHNFIPDGYANTFTTKTTAIRDIIMSISTAALTAGKIHISLELAALPDGGGASDGGTSVAAARFYPQVPIVAGAAAVNLLADPHQSSFRLPVASFLRGVCVDMTDTAMVTGTMTINVYNDGSLVETVTVDSGDAAGTHNEEVYAIGDYPAVAGSRWHIDASLSSGASPDPGDVSVVLLLGSFL